MILSRRALNRATLARQLLLDRADRSAAETVRHLVGIQAQDPNAPYYGLWTRLAGFEKDDLTRALTERSVVRSSMLRGTQHLVHADDYGWLRPLIQPIGDRAHRAAFGKRTQGIDMAELAAAAAEVLRGRTLTRPELGRVLAARWPGYDPLDLGWSAQHFLHLVHIPPNGTWGRGGATPFTLATTGWPPRPNRRRPCGASRRSSSWPAAT